MSLPPVKKHAVFLLLMAFIIIGCFGIYFKERPASTNWPKFLPESRETASSKAAVDRHTKELKKGLSVQQPLPKSFSRASSTDEILSGVQFNDLTGEALAQFKQCAGRVLSKRSNRYVEIPSPQKHCKTMSFRKSGLVVLLVSYPGSGNSWVRQLLETTTGIYSGSLPCDSTYIKAGMIGEGIKTGNVIVVKTHKVAKFLEYDKVIYIIRNPFATLVADWSRFESKKLDKSSRHVNEVDQNHFGE